MSFLSEMNNKKSSQRLNLLGSLAGILYLIFIVGLYILIHSIKGNLIQQAEWIGMSAFVFSLLIGLGVNAGVKAYQKKLEKL